MAQWNSVLLETQYAVWMCVVWKYWTVDAMVTGIEPVTIASTVISLSS